MSEWFVNGDRADTIDIDDRAMQYGDGLFETIAIRNGQPRLWSYHAERLRTGCARLDLDDPGMEVPERQLTLALGACASDTKRATAKLIVTAGPGPRGYRRAANALSILVGIFESRALGLGYYRDGVVARMCSTRLAKQPQLAGIKTLNRLEQVLARREWQDDGVFEGLMLDTDDRLICGTMSNVFLVKDQSFVTPAITQCGVSGVMRRHVLALLDEAGISCDVREIEAGELADCEGLLLTNSQFGVLPVRECGRFTWRSSDRARSVMSLVSGSGIDEGSA